MPPPPTSRRHAAHHARRGDRARLITAGRYDQVGREDGRPPPASTAIHRQHEPSMTMIRFVDEHAPAQPQRAPRNMRAATNTKLITREDHAPYSARNSVRRGQVPPRRQSSSSGVGATQTGGHDGARGELGCDHDSVRLYQHQRLRHSHQHPTRSASQRTSKQHTRAATSGVPCTIQPYKQITTFEYTVT